MLQLVTNWILPICSVAVLRAFHWQAVIIHNTWYKCSTIKPQQLWGFLNWRKLWGFCTISGLLTCTIHASKHCSKDTTTPNSIYIYIYTHTYIHIQTHIWWGGGGGSIRWHYIVLLKFPIIHPAEQPINYKPFFSLVSVNCGYYLSLLHIMLIVLTLNHQRHSKWHLSACRLQCFLNSETLNKDLVAKYFKTCDIYFPPFLLPHVDCWHKIFFRHFSSASTPISYSSIHPTMIPNYEILFITDTDLLSTWKGRWQWNIQGHLL
jgi:hypothetical protein